MSTCPQCVGERDTQSGKLISTIRYNRREGYMFCKTCGRRWALARSNNSVQPTDGTAGDSSLPTSLFGGVKVVTSKFTPDKMAVLRQGEKVVAIVNIGEAQQSVHPTKATPRWFEVLVNKFMVLCSRLRW